MRSSATVPPSVLCPSETFAEQSSIGSEQDTADLPASALGRDRRAVRAEVVAPEARQERCERRRSCIRARKTGPEL